MENSGFLSCMKRTTLIKPCGFLLLATLLYVEISSISTNRSKSVPLRPAYYSRNVSGEHGEEVCSIKRNFMFVKVHKAGGTTTTCIFQRFGYEHNLTFVLSVIRTDVGWPNLLRQEDFIPSADSTYNVLVDHTVYNRRLLKHLMPPDTMYISILRHPLAQLRSTFNWYALARKIPGLKGADPVASFLQKARKLHVPYVKARSRTREPYTLTKNFMAFDLGFPLGLSDDQSYVDEFIQKISREIDLVLILEYFTESLVLLKRMMCWTFKDILYNVVPKNLRKYKKGTTSNATLQKHRQWSNVDYQLYDHFNATLWQKIEDEGDDFVQEVHHFQKVLNETTIYCTNTIKKVPVSEINSTARKLTIPKSAWNDEFDIDPILCLKLKMGWFDWEYVLKKKHKMPPNLPVEVKRAIAYSKPQVVGKTLLPKLFHVH
ncbi:GAL3ST1 [Branchiostoma lanceolatum]|nr:GAL3ST1 [Branchiostoma lanceolatum]